MGSVMRPSLQPGDGKGYCPKNGTAYLMIYTAIEDQPGLIHGRLHDRGAHCAVGSYWETNPRASLDWALVDEVAAVNDSVPHYTPRKRKLHVQRWLKWKLTQLGMPGFRTQTPTVAKKR